MTDEDMENPKKRHLGCPEYGQGASSFWVFIASKIKQSCDEEKEYYTKAEMVFFEGTMLLLAMLDACFI